MNDRRPFDFTAYAFAAMCAAALALMLCFTGCAATSASYKTAVATTYPKIAERMDTYPLTAEESAEVKTLRDVSAVRKNVSYGTARPAWEAVAPDYRRYVGSDSGEHLLPGKSPEEQERRRADWLKTAEIIDRAQDAEAEYHNSIFGN